MPLHRSIIHNMKAHIVADSFVVNALLLHPFTPPLCFRLAEEKTGEAGEWLHILSTKRERMQ